MSALIVERGEGRHLLLRSFALTLPSRCDIHHSERSSSSSGSVLRFLSERFEQLHAAGDDGLGVVDEAGGEKGVVEQLLGDQ